MIKPMSTASVPLATAELLVKVTVTGFSTDSYGAFFIFNETQSARSQFNQP
jgi:hypothetical protein